MHLQQPLVPDEHIVGACPAALDQGAIIASGKPLFAVFRGIGFQIGVGQASGKGDKLLHLGKGNPGVGNELLEKALS